MVAFSVYIFAFCNRLFDLLSPANAKHFKWLKRLKPCNILIPRKLFYLSTRCETSKTILSKIPLLSVLMCQLTKNGQQRIFVDNKLLKDLFAIAGTAGYFLAERPFDSWLSILSISFFMYVLLIWSRLKNYFPGILLKRQNCYFLAEKNT